MGKKKKLTKANNLNIGSLFLGFFLFLFLISIIIKLIIVFQNSRFDSVNRFTIAVEEKDDIKVISFSPQERTISILSIDGKINENVGKFLGVPIDDYIVSNDISVSRTNISSSFLKSILDLKKFHSKLTFIDVLRLSYFAKFVPLTSIYEKKISPDLDMLTIDLMTSSFFTDQQVSGEKKRIQIVNGTEITGVGNRLAKVVNNMGGDVVIVSTSDKEEPISKIIYSGNISYTVKKLSAIFNFKIEKSKDTSLANVIIVLGKDKISELRY
jgi:hypothetical protein